MFLLVSLFYNTDRFRVAERLFSNRLTEDVKMWLNISDKFALRSRMSPFCSYHILTSPIWFTSEQTRGDRESAKNVKVYGSFKEIMRLICQGLREFLRDYKMDLRRQNRDAPAVLSYKQTVFVT